MEKVGDVHFEANWQTSDDIEDVDTDYRKTLKAAQALIKKKAFAPGDGWIVEEIFDGREWIEVCRYTPEGKQYHA